MVKVNFNQKKFEVSEFSLTPDKIEEGDIIKTVDDKLFWIDDITVEYVNPDLVNDSELDLVEEVEEDLTNLVYTFHIEDLQQYCDILNIPHDAKFNVYRLVKG